ncbi:hypothetical protein BU15DRAFT_62118 [Melanogaster broomeanus]|nr:hypothetical protein BU15DRAFT_62118 [Melanogaster broomeanus]
MDRHVRSLTHGGPWSDRCSLAASWSPPRGEFAYHSTRSVHDLVSWGTGTRAPFFPRCNGSVYTLWIGVPPDFPKAVIAGFTPDGAEALEQQDAYDPHNNIVTVLVEHQNGPL